MIKYTFKSGEEYANYLFSLLAKLNESGEYNIFAHQINNSTKALESSNTVLQKLAGIEKYGLECGKYGSINGTLAFLGSSTNICARDFMEYCYYPSIKNRVVCFFALPKYINVSGKYVEFSSFGGANGLDATSLVEAAKIAGLCVDVQHMKSNLFDAIKGNGDIDKIYFLGASEKDTDGLQINFYANEKHLSLAPKAEQEEFYRLRENEALKLYDKFKTTNLAEIIVKSYKEEQENRDKIIDFDY